MYFCGVNCNVSIFISDFIYLSHLSFFLVLAIDLSFLKNAFSFIDLFYYFSDPYFIYFHSELTSFLLTMLGLACSLFSSSLSYKVTLLILFLVF